MLFCAVCAEKPHQLDSLDEKIPPGELDFPPNSADPDRHEESTEGHSEDLLTAVKEESTERHSEELTAIKEEMPTDDLHRYDCSYCKKTFLQPEHLNLHLRSHADKRAFTCPTCSRS